MERYACIHGHFYQPPRENPWLEAIEVQDSAAPYHDWNERVNAECYAPNTAARMLGERGVIRRIVNNYERISFNFGPTLLHWMEANAPETYRAIQEADRNGARHFGGHGPALAQAYNHMILPLASGRDKRTQVVWGVRDFEHRFGRRPEGMWLPETAVDLETLERLAEAGIRFTILAPRQAGRVRRLGETAWTEVGGGRVDPTRAYLQRLPSGRDLALFFYDGGIAQDVAFGQLLNRGENLAHRLAGALNDSSRPQLAHVATDGETYGHHHRFGEMALAQGLRTLEEEGAARITIYGEYLERHPPEFEVEILENTSWSCVHGVERWRSDCGCSTGGNPGWNQAWRAPLREALDALHGTLDRTFETDPRGLLRDPWAARDAYIDVVLDRSPASVDRFLAEHASRPLLGEERTEVLERLEMQRHAMLMMTSCGWFFNDLAGIETIQIIRYASRAVELAERILGGPLEEEFLARLALASSNDPAQGDGRRIYERSVRPSRVDLADVGAHFAVSRPFHDYGPRTRVFGFTVDEEDARMERSGGATLALGRIRVVSAATEQTARLTYGVYHRGDHRITAGARPYRGTERFEAMAEDVKRLFDRGDGNAVLERFDDYFAGRTYSLESLFRDERRRIIEIALAAGLAKVERLYGRIYRNLAGLMHYLAALDTPQPEAFRAAVRVVLGRDLREALTDEGLPVERIRHLAEEARTAGMDLSDAEFGRRMQISLERAMESLLRRPEDLAALERLEAAVALLEIYPFPVETWRLQNLFYRFLAEAGPHFEVGEREAAERWEAALRETGRRLQIRVESLDSDPPSV